MQPTANCLYTVYCTLPDATTARRWVAWLLDEHLDEVRQAGAREATLVQLDTASLDYEVRYVFPSRAAYDRYAEEYAPTLKAKGIRRFPPDLGLIYRRAVGEEIS